MYNYILFMRLESIQLRLFVAWYVSELYPHTEGMEVWYGIAPSYDKLLDRFD